MVEFKLGVYELKRLGVGLVEVRRAALELRDARTDGKRSEIFKRLDGWLFNCGESLRVLEERDGVAGAEDERV